MQHCSYLGCPLGICFKNTNNPMWQKGSSRVTEGNWTIGVSSIQPKESSNCFSFCLLLEGVEEECGAISHSLEDISWLQSFQVKIKISGSPVSTYSCKISLSLQHGFVNARIGSILVIFKILSYAEQNKVTSINMCC